MIMKRSIVHFVGCVGLQKRPFFSFFWSDFLRVDEGGGGSDKNEHCSFNFFYFALFSKYQLVLTDNSNDVTMTNK